MTTRRTALAIAALGMVCAAMLDARQAAPECRVSGRATATVPLPGVAIVVRSGNLVKAVTSTEVDGTYQLTVATGAYRLIAELTGFSRIERDIVVEGSPCVVSVDLAMTLVPRAARPATPPVPQPSGTRATPAAAGRFEALAVEAQAAGTTGLEVNPPERENVAAALLLPPGFSTDGPSQALAITGNMASIDRGMMGDRFDAIARGEFDPATGEVAQGFEPSGGGRGGRMGGPGGRQGGPGGEGFLLGGRGGRGQNAYTLQSTYAFSGSALDADPYQLGPASRIEQPPYTRQNFGATFGGPFRIPGVYNGTRRTSFVLNYGGSRGGTLFEQYATVPTLAMRAGDFSGSSTPIVDPSTGQPFPDNVIPLERMSPSARALLRFIPAPNLGGTARNFYYSTSNGTSSDSVSLRLAHSFTPAAAGGRGGRGGGGMGRGGGGGLAQRGTSVSMNAQVQYRRNENEQVNVFPTLGGESRGSSFALPVGLNIVHRGNMFTANVTLSRTTAETTNLYAYVEDVAGGAGISGVATDPFDWGVPQLSFSSLSSVRDLTPTERRDTRVSVTGGWTRVLGRHTLRAGGDVRVDQSNNQTDNNARGAFVFTGVYASGGNTAVHGDGLDVADFLLGVPQQASVQYGPGDVHMSGRSMSLYVQDDWRRSASLTVNAGVRYELLWPFVEDGRRMVNLDVPPDFTAATPVVSGATGPFTGTFPAGLVQTDVNNIAPRVGFAWRVVPGTIVRGGYGVSYNSGSYSTIARQMVGQPPFAVTNAAFGTLEAPLSLATPFASASPAETTNNYGVEKEYALGVVQTWNGDVSRDVRQVWNVGAGYTYIHGSNLDIVRAPNRGPGGLRIEGVNPFLWQSSEGASRMHAASFRIRRRPANGIGGGLSYTIGRSRDNASSIGGGTTVAQDDRNLEAEWGLSNFDRRHQLAGDVSVELPFGPNRPFLNSGGPWAALLRDWRVATTFTWQSGTPYTATVTGDAYDVARGTNGSLRADYTGQPIDVPDASIDRFFNTSAFVVPATGTFGNSSRNMILGPGSRLLNAQISRDLRLGGNRALTIQVNTTNLLNMANYARIDTVVNSPTFGQVLSVRPMRSTQFNLRFRF